MSQCRILDDGLFEHIDSLDPKEQSEWLFLAPHPDYTGRWYVDALNQSFFLDFEDIIGQYRVVSPASLQEFLEYARDYGYQVAFTEDPTLILEAWEHLYDSPKFKINSDMAEMLDRKRRNDGCRFDSSYRTAALSRCKGSISCVAPDIKGGLRNVVYWNRQDRT
jgi:hypothetical protein